MNKEVKSALGNKEIFSRNLRRYLESSGTKQKELAAAVKVTPSTICDWTKGRGYPRMDKLQLLADYFGIQKSDLVEDVYVAKETVSNKEQIVLDLFHKIPDDNKELAIKMLQAMIKNQ